MNRIAISNSQVQYFTSTQSLKVTRKITAVYMVMEYSVNGVDYSAAELIKKMRTAQMVA